MTRDEKLDKISELAADLVSEYISDDWEGTGYSCFDPFGEYRAALRKALEKEFPE